MRLPVMPPVDPMLAKSIADHSRRQAVRAQVGRLPRDRVPRRGLRGDRLAQHQADAAVLPGGRRGGPRLTSPNGASSTGRSSCRLAAHGWTSRRCCSGCTRRSRGCGCSPSRRRRVSCVRPAGAGRRGPDRHCRCRRGGAGSKDALGGAAPPIHVTPSTRPAPWPSGGSRSSRGPGSTGSSRRISPDLRARQADRCRRSSTSGPPTAWSPGTGRTSPGRMRSGRCCSGCTTTTGCWRRSGWRRRSRWRVVGRWSTSWRRW